MVDIQSVTAEIRRGKRQKEEEETTGQNIMSASATQGGHNNSTHMAWECSLLQVYIRDVTVHILLGLIPKLTRAPACGSSGTAEMY